MATPHSAPTAPSRRRRRGLVALVVLVLLLIVFLLLALARCGNDDTSTATSDSSSGPASTATQSAAATQSATASATTDSSAPSPSSSAGTGPAGQLSAGSTTLFPLSSSAGTGGDLSKFVGQRVTATAVTVQSVPADEGFWVGTSTADRVWVQLTGKGESPYKVKPGQKVSFSGAMVAHSGGFPTQVGVTAAEGAPQLSAEKAHVEVPRTSLTFAH